MLCSRRVAVSPFLPFAVSLFFERVTVSLPFLARVSNRSRLFTVRFYLSSFEAPAHYRRPDIESHGVSCGSVSTPKKLNSQMLARRKKE